MIPFNPFSVEGKFILVTGASSGIGKQVAIEASKMGAKLIITARNKDRLQVTYSQLEGSGHTLITADLLVLTEVEKMVSILPQIDGIVNCAGIAKPKPFQFINMEEIDFIMATNFSGPVFLTNLLIRRKLLKKNSSIVFISSIAGVVCSSYGGSAYSASKGALNGFIKGLALDLAPKKIRVNSILPGVVETGIFDESSISAEQLEVDKKRYPLGRYGKPEEIAYAAIYLISDASSWMTGSNLLIDGGYTLI